MTLNDLEILNGHFTLNFHYYLDPGTAAVSRRRRR